MDSDLKVTKEVDVKEDIVECLEDEVVSESTPVDNSEDVIMIFNSNENQTEDQIEDQNKDKLLVNNSGATDSDTPLPTEDNILNPNTDEEIKQIEEQFDDILGNEEVLTKDDMVLDECEGMPDINRNEDNEESQEFIESPKIESEIHLVDVDMTSDNPVIRNESTSDSTDENIKEILKSNGTAVRSSDEDMSDSELRIAGLKTSLMLSEDKVRELEEELKRVYTHLFKCLDEKKSLQKKSDTLEEQLEKLMATSAQKRPAQESPGNNAKSTPPKKTPNIKQQNSEQNRNNSKNKKSVRFQEQRPFFGRFGARFQNNDMTPPPYPGRFAPVFQPPTTAMAMTSRVSVPPMGTFRAPPVMAVSEMKDMALTDGFQTISTIGNRLQLTASIVDRAIRLFRQCYESPLRAMCRTQNQSTATACVYIACREEHCPQTFKTLCSVSRTDFKVMNQCCKHIINTLGLCLDQMSIDEAIIEFCGRSAILPIVQRAANQIARKSIQSNIISAQNPLTAVASAIFMATMASDDQRPVFEISSLTGVSDTTIRNTYNRLLPFARQLFPPNFPYYTQPERLPRV